ncbi:ubiquitin ligase subunit CulD [Xylaria bambusicola]|uniref:ubiquitin ligase subunit CulD n=1 Tax=Xylaria bambusicola TaxID=326684 RepID=UPI002007BE2B|nr:ubiquitin ligase subunit CulD [Xylaria bambusicola]KAI0526500.1 ubiquitin ligase subunit CulD [Xylaria bambusicola]
MPSPFRFSPDGPIHSAVIPSKRRLPQTESLSSRHDNKRQRDTVPSAPDSCTMSKALGKRPATQPVRSAFEPNKGAKKLIVSRLRTVSRSNDVEQYYEKRRNELKVALAAIFNNQQPKQPLETLYRGVEDICRHGDARDLFDILRAQCESYLNSRLHQAIMANGGSSNIDMLRAVSKYWTIWNSQSTTIRSIFSYLDRSFLLNNKELPQINDLAIMLFRKMVFASVQSSPSSVGAKSLVGLCDLIDYDRKGDSRFDPALLRDSISMLNVLNVYGKLFEPLFLKTSSAYLHEFAEELSASSLKSYISACEKLLAREDDRCNAFNFDSTTKRQLMNAAHVTLIDDYSEKLLDGGSIGKILDENSVESMKALYDLLRLSDLQRRLRGPWEDYIKNAGSAIVNDTSRGDEMVVRLLEFRKTLDIMVRDAFKKDDDFTHGLRQAFDNFINDKKNMTSRNSGTSKVGEMIAKYVDMLLRGGLKTLPASLLSDVQDRVDAEKRGQASTGDEDAELDRQLDKALELFRFIEGKGVFEAFYKQDLARRLLMGRSASADAERSMLAKLKSECGSDFTRNLEQMFKDQQMARDEMDSYKEWREGNGYTKTKLDLNVSILSAAAWPTYPDTQLLLPDGIASQLEQFATYYTNKHTGRRLTWKHSLAHCVVRASFNKGPKELLVSAYQAIVLTIFNQTDEPVSYQQIAERSGLSGRDLDRTLQSLACGKVRVITKDPKGKDVNPTDKFLVNKSFSDPKFRIKINQIQLKETKEENQETHERVARDRQFETQAAIVRIMKSRKTMTHANLVAEVINQTKKRGAVDTSEIKQNIEKLIEKDYLEREGSSYTYLA